jgi:CRISPR-associated exonuclease Cas4
MKEITGTMYGYSFLCLRKLWYFAHNITMEQESENVAIGKLIDEESFKREKKNILIDDNINIDYVKDGIVYEIKKSDREKHMAVNQIKYYLYRLQAKGIKTKGVLTIPAIRHKEEIVLNEQDSLEIAERLLMIDQIIKSDKIPSLERKKVCSKCAYYDLCII